MATTIATNPEGSGVRIPESNVSPPMLGFVLGPGLALGYIEKVKTCPLDPPVISKK